ncbi:MAG: hypothetical protein ACOCVF_01160 [bacterium]
MGVMNCSRPNCENIMCDTHIPFIGYICWECQSEFKKYLESEGKTKFIESEINKELNKFMESRKNDFVYGESINIDDFFEKYT